MGMSLVKRLRRRLTPFNIMLVLFTVAFVVFFAFPYYWQVVSSLKTPQAFSRFPPDLIPNPIYLERYVYTFVSTHIPITVRNSFVISSTSTIVCVMLAIFSSYGIGRCRIRGGNIIMVSVTIVSMLPAISQLGPLYMVFGGLHLINTRLGLTIAYSSLFMPFSMWFLTGFFRTVPDELEDAASIDGCGVFQTIFRIIIPVSVPAIFTIALLIFIFTWNEFLFAFTLTTTYDVTTYPVGLVLLNPEHEVPWGTLTTASTIVSLPVIVAVMIAQKYLIKGITAGAVKG